MPIALLSVSDKSGLVDFATQLTTRGWSLVSTGGTAHALRAAGLAVRDVGDLTGVAEMLDGRVKTLHPVVHGGILARRDVPEHVATLAAHGIAPIDLVVVNLYPFRETVARGAAAAETVEQIDIGGPALLRSAAKNFAAVTVVCDPADYPRVALALDAPDPDAARALRRELAGKVFAHTAAYDAAIAAWFERGDDGAAGAALPATLAISASRGPVLRYGENPDQRAAFYVDAPGHGLDALRQLGGRELSFNNLLDLEGALLAADAFDGEPACVIVKHTTPCGVAVGATALDAYERALACDPVSAFGSVIAFTVPLDEGAAARVAALFVECIVAPAATPGAVELLARKRNLRVLVGRATWSGDALDLKRVRGGYLAQTRPPAPMSGIDWRTVTRRAPTEDEARDLAFAWRAVAAVKSNAIVLARGGGTIGIGAGQMSRVDAAFVAVHKARTAGHDTHGAALASDAFFPFRDGVDHAAEAGITAIVQPGGSVRDAEAIAAADEHGIAMVFTGRRVFRH